MLYDNAQLAWVYLHAWQITRDDFYRRITEQTLDYVATEMTDPQGGFYSSEDADSEGVEGKFFVWTPEEIRLALGHPERSAMCLGAQSKDERAPIGAESQAIQSGAPAESKDAQLFIDAYGVTERGNFEGKNILYVARDLDVLAAMHNLSIDEVETRLAAALRKLFEVREGRVKPARDEKVLTGWNGLMLAAFAESARALKREDYRAVAERNADFILHELRDGEGRLRRSWKAGDVRHMGYLEDYANLIEGLLALYETTFDERWFVAARELADTMLAHFADAGGGFFDTSDDAEALVTRPKDLQDNAVPSGNAMAATVLLKLGAFTGEGRYIDASERALRMVQPALGSAPTGFAQWLSALDFALGQPKEIAIVGERADAQELLDVVFGEYHPNQVVAYREAHADTVIPLLQGREAIEGEATAYVCQNFACQMPVTTADALKEKLNR